MEFKTFNVDQIALISAIFKELSRQNPGLPLEPALYNKVIESADLIVDECKRERVYSRQGMTPKEWLESDDVVVSSRYMITVLADLGHPQPDGDTPRDAADLGRCIRMVEACDLESEIPRLLYMGDKWQKIAENWQALKALYKSEKSEEIYNFFQTLE